MDTLMPGRMAGVWLVESLSGGQTCPIQARASFLPGCPFFFSRFNSAFCSTVWLKLNHPSISKLTNHGKTVQAECGAKYSLYWDLCPAWKKMKPMKPALGSPAAVMQTGCYGVLAGESFWLLMAWPWYSSSLSSLCFPVRCGSCWTMDLARVCEEWCT